MESVQSKLELTLSCSHLVNLDVLSKSDPQVIVYMKEVQGVGNQQRVIPTTWTELGRTEIIWDNLNPKFVKSFIIDYRFEVNQYLKFVVIDIDNQHSRNLDDQELIGQIECTVGEIVGSRGSRLDRKLIHPQHPTKQRGYIHVRAEEVQGINDVVHFTLSASKLDKKDWFGKSDPFLVISRANEDNEFQPVFKSEVYKRTLNVRWKPFAVPVQKLCNGDNQRPIRIECWDWNRSGSHQLIGQTNCNLDQLLQAGPSKSYDLIEPKKQQKKGNKYKNSGVLLVENIRLEKVASFLDYVRGGYNISLVVAIDFTASNGKPQESSSLHYINPNPQYLNDYQKAIIGVGEILAHYDSDKQFPVYGFGARIPPQYHVSHCFPANMNWSNPEVSGVQGILSAYNYAVQTVTLHGPTNFANVISSAATNARRDAATSYYILLILTDGEICDMDATVHEIVEASDLPLSIIIVGIGPADFGKMDILDADDNPLYSRGKKQSRDIVQFVPFRNYKNVHHSILAEEVLREVPTQFLSYMRQHNIQPREALRADSFNASFISRPQQQEPQQPQQQHSSFIDNPNQQYPPRQDFNPNQQQYGYSVPYNNPQSQIINPNDINVTMSQNPQNRFKSATYAVMFANQMSGMNQSQQMQQQNSNAPPYDPNDISSPQYPIQQ